MTDQTMLKDLFALALLHTPNEPFRAACQIFGTDTVSALRAASEWTQDTYVLSRQAEMLEKFGEETFLPSKLTLARRVFELAENIAKETKDRLKAYELYANIRGFIEKQTAIANVTNNNITSNRVMVIKDFGTDDQWETAALDQQRKLIEHSRD